MKRRWSEEETSRLALAEAELILEGYASQDINKELMRRGVTDRSLEALKGKRKSKKYKDLVQSLINSMNVARNSSTQGSDDVDAAKMPNEETLDDSDLSLLPLASGPQTSGGTTSEIDSSKRDTV